VQTGDIPIKYKEGGKEVEIPGQAREERNFGGKGYIMEEAIKGDYAFIKVWKADEYGNCVFRCVFPLLSSLFLLSPYLPFLPFLTATPPRTSPALWLVLLR
jgi:hypothetical protein